MWGRLGERLSYQSYLGIGPWATRMELYNTHIYIYIYTYICMIYNTFLEADSWWTFNEIAVRLSLDLTYDESTLVQKMTWCRQATSHYLDHCWPRSMLLHDIISPQWVNSSPKLWRAYFTNKIYPEVFCTYVSIYRYAYEINDSPLYLNRRWKWAWVNNCVIFYIDTITYLCFNLGVGLAGQVNGALDTLPDAVMNKRTGLSGQQ